jgi:hypothetical protein
LRAMSSTHWTGTRINDTLENKDSFTMALMPRLRTRSAESVLL